VPERATVSSRSEKSAEVVVVGGEAAKPARRRRAEREGVFDAMSMWRASHQKPARAGRPGVGRDESACGSGRGEARRPRHEPKGTGSALLLAALARENLQRAWKRVRANKGVAGVDGLDINQTAEHLRTAWPAIREQLLSGTYRPSPVRRATIPKPEGGERELGIPTVTDRLIQQALLGIVIFLLVGMLSFDMAVRLASHAYLRPPNGEGRFRNLSILQFTRLYLKLKTMNSSETELNKTPDKRPNIFLRLLGPGLVTGAADDDPSGIATYSQAGAQFGYRPSSGLEWQLNDRRPTWHVAMCWFAESIQPSRSVASQTKGLSPFAI
jgi:hypothetical protein